MTTSLDCVPCFVRQALEAARLVSCDAAVHEQILREVLRAAADLDLRQPPPVFGQRIHRRLRELTATTDPYREAKDRFNRLALELVPELSARVQAAADPLELAVRLAIASNVVDLAPNGELREADVKRALAQALTEPLAGDLNSFRAAVAAAGSILYLADNAGEIVFDRLLIEQLPTERVTVAVRGAPVINDATRADALAAGLDQLVAVIDNGSDAPGTVLVECSREFRACFESAAMIIAKGQGNFETLSDSQADIFFLLKIKCPLVAAQTGLEVGKHALIHRRGMDDGAQ